MTGERLAYTPPHSPSPIFHSVARKHTPHTYLTRVGWVSVFKSEIYRADRVPQPPTAHYHTKHQVGIGPIYYSNDSQVTLSIIYMDFLIRARRNRKKETGISLGSTHIFLTFQLSQSPPVQPSSDHQQWLSSHTRVQLTRAHSHEFV